MPATQVVTHRTVDGFQKQYGTLWNAAEAYLTGAMTREQMVAFETTVDHSLIAARAQTRLLAELARWVQGQC